MPLASSHVCTVLSKRSDIQLPTELLSIIINELGSDAKALASCRLASYALCSLTTPLLFSSLELWEDSKAIFQGEFERARNLNKLLSNPDIADLVHTFTLYCGKRFLEDSRIGLLISTILHRLSHIRTFRFYGDWESFPIPSDISPAIQALCKSPNLTTLKLDSFESLPITVITACPNLRFLHLLRVEFNFGDVTSVDETSTLQPFYLDFFEVDMSSLSSLGLGISHKKSFAKYFSRIRSLQVENLLGSHSVLKFGWDMILLTSQTLTTLNLSGYDRDDIWDLPPSRPLQDFPFDLGRLPALRHFTVQLPAWFSRHLVVLRFLIRLLSISSSASGIETLELKIFWCEVDDPDLILDFFSFASEWMILDQVLTSAKFVSLRKVVLDWVLEVTDIHARPSWEFHNFSLDRLFPKLKRRCILEAPLEIAYPPHDH